MDKFIKLLINKTNSINGHKNSALQIKKILFHEEAQIQRPQSKKHIKALNKQVDHRVMMKGALIYKIMRARAKISFRCMREAKPFH